MAGVGLHHHRQFELAYPLVGQAEADDAGTLADHHRHLFVGHGFGGEDEIPFVLPIFIVGHQHAAAGTQSCQRRFDTGNGITKFTEKRLIHGKTPKQDKDQNQGMERQTEIGMQRPAHGACLQYLSYPLSSGL